MGIPESKIPPSPPSLLLPEPWRTVDWNRRHDVRNILRHFEVSNPDVERLRILVLGPTAAGKSSFINSIDSIFQDRMTCAAIAETSAGHSFTKTYKTHTIKDGRYGAHLPFILCDDMGLERGDSEGAQTEDLIKILEGHIKEGYTFNPTNPCSAEGEGYNKNPTLSDRIHCLVCVIPADGLIWCADASRVPRHTMMEKDQGFINKIRDIRAHASKMGIPQVVILTKVDEACPKVKRDIKMIYRSIAIKDKIERCSFNVGVTKNYIFPVKNYHEEIELNNDMDILLLSALTNILNFANDYVAEMKKD